MRFLAGTVAGWACVAAVTWGLAPGALAGPEGIRRAAPVPERLALDGRGQIYVTDARQGLVRVFSATGDLLRTLRLDGRPSAVAVTREGRLLVVDRSRNRVDILDEQGESQGYLAGLEDPTAVAEDAKGRLLVTEGKRSDLRVYSAAGVLVQTVALPGALPVALAVAADGRVYVADARGGQVLVVTGGQVSGSLGSFGDGPGQLTRPAGVALGTDGNIYVVDSFQSRLAVFTPGGAFLRFLGGYGTDGAGGLSQPADVAADPRGGLLVADQGNGRLQRLGAQSWSVVSLGEAPAASPEPAAESTPAKEPEALNCSSTAAASGWWMLLVLAGLLSRRRALVGLLPVLLLATPARAVDAPHTTPNLQYGCADCHTPHNAPALAITTSAGNANLCITCHAAQGNAWVNADQSLPGTSGTSHRWDAPAVNAGKGAGLPSSPELLAKLDASGKLMCSTCHDQHSQANAPFDPSAPGTAGTAGRHFMQVNNQNGQMCVDCHAAWNVTSAGNGTWTGNPFSHPVGVAIPAASPLFNAVPLDVNKVAQVAFTSGAATGGSTTTLLGSFAGNLVGQVVRFTSGANQGTTRAITANTAASITFAAVPTAIAAGVTYEIDADGNLTNNLVLQGATGPSYTAGNVVCMTCHGAHYADSNSATYDNAPGTGDGRLLRRSPNDDACVGCHQEKTHNSANTSTKYGTWGASFSCLTCHDAHGTPNISLVRQAIVTPNSGTKAVDFRTETGKADNSYASVTNAGTGVCEVCHTRTCNADNSPRFRNTGGSDGDKHSSAKCTSCHAHKNAFAASCTSCHAFPPASGTHLTHVGLMQNQVYGGLDTANDLPGNATGYAYGCGQCHPLDISKHMNGVNDVEFYNATAPVASIKFKNPVTAAYAPGGTNFTDAEGLQYTKGTCSNIYCHSGISNAAPSIKLPMTTVTDPATQFQFAGYPIVYPAYTLITTRTYQDVTWGDTPRACGGCHGNPIRNTSPNNAAGAGDSHSWIDDYGYENLHAFNMSWAPLQCRTCHYSTVTGTASVTRDGMDVTTYGNAPIASFKKHVNGTAEVQFDTTNAAAVYNTMSYGNWTPNLGMAAYDPATRTCSNVQCHSNAANPDLYQPAVVWGTPYRWENSYECDVCHHR